jgi:transcriptional regulator GlxA family with amidase domain
MVMRPQRHGPLPHHVVMVGFPDAQILDITGPLEVFARTARWLIEHAGLDREAYTVEIVAADAGPIRTSSSLKLIAERSYHGVRAGIDTLLVSGGVGVIPALRDQALLRWIARQSTRVARLGSVCSGTFLLAAAGLLDGRRATTHWRVCDTLAERYPSIHVEPDSIFVRDGNVYTSAGVTAGMDLALALVEEDHGGKVAAAVAREMVLFLRRPGGQSQFSAVLEHQAADRVPLRELQAWMAENPHADLSVEALAERVAMSPRNFARVFRKEVGMPPARFVDLLRVEAARRRLEESTLGVKTIAAQCGFGTEETMRRSFQRTLRIAPADYRARFASPRRDTRHASLGTSPPPAGT